MDYFVIIILTVIIFTFMSDKKLLSIEKISETIENIEQRIDCLQKDLYVLSIEKYNYNSLKDLKNYVHERIKKYSINKKYILIKNKDVVLDEKTQKTLISNYIKENNKASIYMPSYEYQYINHKKVKDILKELNIVGVNYLNIFSKSKIKTFGVLILRVDEFENIKYNNFIFFSPNSNFKILLKNSEKKTLKKVIKNYSGSISAFIKSLLLIVVGAMVTGNILKAIYSAAIINIIIAIIIYWCYIYVLNYMYLPIGKYKILSKYLLPIFLVIYFILQIISIIKRNIFRNKKVHAS